MRIKQWVPRIKKISGDMHTPISLYTQYVGDDIGFLLESKEQPKGRYSFLGKDPFATIEKRNGEILLTEQGITTRKKGVRALDFVKEYMAQWEHIKTDSYPFAGGAVGTVGYDVIREYEKLPGVNHDEIGVPDLHLMFMKNLIAYDHFHSEIILIALDDDTEQGRMRAQQSLSAMQSKIEQPTHNGPLSNRSIESAPRSVLSQEQFVDKVRKAKQYIEEGDIFQVVLSNRWAIQTKAHSFALYRKLRQVNPSPYLFYFNFGGYQVAGSSPEMLVEVRGDRVYTCPIAGTRKRGLNEAHDAALAEELVSDEKEIAEHSMLVDLARNDMGRIAKIGTVELTKQMEVHKYSHVMHLVSLVEGMKSDGEDVFSILASFLPAGTLSGAPKIRAMEIIDELETVKRGIYGGAAGYFGFDGNMDMCIAIRTMVIQSNTVYMQAGAGIVADSDPIKEYEESMNKMLVLHTAIRNEREETDDFTDR